MVRNGAGIAKPADLAGKAVAVPFVSTTHYSLLAALKHWGIDPASVRILNLRPPEIAVALAPLPRCSTIWLSSARSRPRKAATRRET